MFCVPFGIPTKDQELDLLGVRIRVLVFNATLSNIAVIWWQSVPLVEETGVPGENHRPAASHWQTLSHNVVLNTPCLYGIRTHNVSGDMHWLNRYCKCNYHRIMTTTSPGSSVILLETCSVLTNSVIFISLSNAHKTSFQIINIYFINGTNWTSEWLWHYLL